jgi:hypothetical protein
MKRRGVLGRASVKLEPPPCTRWPLVGERILVKPGMPWDGHGRLCSSASCPRGQGNNHKLLSLLGKQVGGHPTHAGSIEYGAGSTEYRSRASPPPGRDPPATKQEHGTRSIRWRTMVGTRRVCGRTTGSVSLSLPLPVCSLACKGLYMGQKVLASHRGQCGEQEEICEIMVMILPLGTLGQIIQAVGSWAGASCLYHPLFPTAATQKGRSQTVTQRSAQWRGQDPDAGPGRCVVVGLGFQGGCGEQLLLIALGAGLPPWPGSALVSRRR